MWRVHSYSSGVSKDRHRVKDRLYTGLYVTAKFKNRSTRAIFEFCFVLMKGASMMEGSSYPMELGVACQIYYHFSVQNVDIFGRLAVVAQKLAKNINILDIKASVLLAGCSASFERLQKYLHFDLQ